MKIVDLTEEQLSTYFICLEDWSEIIKEAGNHKEIWYKKNKDKGLRVKVAVVDGKVCGMIQYIPVEHSFIEGRDLYFIMCIWVHGYKEGIGNYQKNGIGKALLNAAEEDVRSSGRKGLAAWGIALPFWMKASWFKKRGFVRADRNGIAVLLWKKFTDDAEKPSFIKTIRKPSKGENKVNVTSFINGWCPAQNLIHERARRAVLELGDKVQFTSVSTDERETLLDWGISDALYIDGKELKMGPPPSYEKIKKKISKKIKS